MVEDGSDLGPRDAGEPFQELVHGGPIAEVSKSAVTGTRVPRKTQAPLTRSGSRSISASSAHSFTQSSTSQPHSPRRKYIIANAVLMLLGKSEA